MTARTVPFWQQLLNEKFERLATSPSHTVVNLQESQLINFSHGIWATGTISDFAHLNLQEKIKSVAAVRRCELSQMQVKS